jgi:hypothetical protein
LCESEHRFGFDELGQHPFSYWFDFEHVRRNFPPLILALMTLSHISDFGEIPEVVEPVPEVAIRDLNKTRPSE